VSDRDALLAAICANPDDDTPRLVFADWLDEHEPDAKPRAKKAKSAAPSSWAALIRAECEFERLRNDGSDAAVFDYFLEKDDQTLDAVRWERALPDVARIVELHKRIPALRKASRKAMLAALPKVALGLWNGESHRGFPDGVFVDGGPELLARLPELVASVPGTTVTFNSVESGPNPGNPAELLEAGFAGWCRGLSLVPTEAQAELVAEMSRSSETRGVRRLATRWTADSHGKRIMSLIAESPHWSGLRELNLDVAHGLPAEGRERLFAAPHLRGLTRVTIHGGGHSPELAARLGSLTELRSLSLTNSNLDDDAADRLANSPGLAKLRYLDLSFNRITGRGASALLASAHLRNLVVLDFEGNQVRGLDRAALKAAQHGGLRVLNLQSNRLTATDISTITSCPRVRELVYFAACYNPFPESGIARLVKGFGDFAPAVLYLMGKGITTEGAKALANWPAAERIDMLHLSGNSLSVPGAKAIAGCPHLQKLNHICSGAKSDAAREVLRKQFGDRADV
jgi:uncharacterized protein (TIGR02996 family)